MVNTEMLQKIIDDSGLKYKYIASKLGLSYYGLRRKITGLSDFKVGEINDLCDLLEIKGSRKINKIFLGRE